MIKAEVKAERNIFVYPFSASDEDVPADDVDLDGLLDSMDEPGEETEDEEVEDEETEEDTEEDAPEPEPPHKDKANATFANMRVTIAQQKSLLTKLAKAAGIEFTNEADLIAKLNDNALTQLSQKQNIPKELLEKIERLEQDSYEYQQTKLKNAALAGFEQVKGEFGLTQEELMAFAAELDEKDMNPFVKPVDLLAEYKLTHYDEIMNKRVELAVQAALSKSQAADKHSTIPSKQKGSSSTKVENIDTVSALDNLLKDMK
jgi:hypothetical protein